MRVTRALDANVRASLKNLAAMPRRCEKASASSLLNGKRQDFDSGPQSSLGEVRAPTVCQDETPAFDPFWDGPRLLPSFVAQVMGQMMDAPNRRAGVSVETAYGSIPRKALVLDRKS